MPGDVKAVIMGPLPGTQVCGLRMCWECRERFPQHRLQRKPLVSNPGMHRGTCVANVPWCMSGSLTRGGWGKHSRHMHIPQFCVSGKRSIPMATLWPIFADIRLYDTCWIQAPESVYRPPHFLHTQPTLSLFCLQTRLRARDAVTLLTRSWCCGLCP